MMKFLALVLGVVKDGYLPLAVAAHPCFELVAVADDADNPHWVYERNQGFADRCRIPYVQDIEKALAERDFDLAVVSSEAERHCDLAVYAADAVLHVIAQMGQWANVEE